jgi:hypothetical protein
MTTGGTFPIKSPVVPGVLTPNNAPGQTDVFLVRVDDTQANGCDMGLSSRRIDLGLPVVIGLGAWVRVMRRLRRIRRS